MSAPIVDRESVRNPLDYRNNLFVRRVDEIEIVKHKITQAQEGSVNKPIVNFWGISGIGKTWLLNYFYEKYKFDSTLTRTGPMLAKPTFAMLHSFDEDDGSSADLKSVTKKLARDILHQLDPVLSPEEHKQLLQDEGEGNVRGLVRLIVKLSQSYVPLILLDNAELLLESERELLEQHLIEPLVLTNRIVVVVAGRRQIPRWKRVEVRRRVMKADETQVMPFDVSAVQEQIKLCRYNAPSDFVYRYTAGNPHLTNVIARHIDEWTKGEEPDAEWFAENQGALLPILQTYEANVLQRVPEHLEDGLYAVAPLRFYRLEAMRYMLLRKSGSAETLETQPDSYYLRILHELDQSTDIVWWSHPHRAYITDNVVRRIINRRQLLQDADTYAVWHQHAYLMYKGLTDKYKDASEEFIIEAWFHLANIYLATGNWTELTDRVEELVSFAKTNLSPDRLLVLRKSLEEDNGENELLELMSLEPISSELCQRVREQLH